MGDQKDGGVPVFFRTGTDGLADAAAKLLGGFHAFWQNRRIPGIGIVEFMVGHT